MHSRCGPGRLMQPAQVTGAELAKPPALVNGTGTSRVTVGETLLSDKWTLGRHEGEPRPRESHQAFRGSEAGSEACRPHVGTVVPGVTCRVHSSQSEAGWAAGFPHYGLGQHSSLSRQ